MDRDGDRDLIGTLDLTPKVQMRSRRRENMSKEVRTMSGVSTQ